MFLFIDLEANKFNWHRNHFAITEYLSIIAKHDNTVEETVAHTRSLRTYEKGLNCS